MAAVKQQTTSNDSSLQIDEHYLLWTVVLSLVFSLSVFAAFYYITHDIFYIDTDNYTLALRIIDWLQNFQWSEKMFPYYNPPHGYILCWSRLCDLIWGFLALPFLLFLPVKEAVFYSGFLFSPLFMALTMMTIMWGIKPYLANFQDKSRAILIAILTLLFYATKFHSVFDAVRPDHHSLMCFIFCLNISVILRNCKQLNLKATLLAGIAGGCGIWGSSAIEGFWGASIMLFVLAINWIFYSHTIKEQLYYILGIFLSVAFAWIINPPFGGWLVIDIQRISIIYVVLTSMMFFSYWYISSLNLQTKSQKILALAGGAFLTIATTLLIFGIDIWCEPIFSSDIWEYCFKYIDEIQHLKSNQAPNIIIIWSFSILGGLLLLCDNSKHLINLTFLTIFCYITTAIFLRFYPYLIMTFSFLSALLLFELMHKGSENIKFKWLAFSYMVVTTLPFLATYIKHEPFKAPQLKNSALVDMMDVPEVVFYQNIDAVGGPYHPNAEGIVDNYLMWFTTDENELKKLIKKHNISSIYLKSKNRPDYYIEPEKNTDKLYGKVMTGKNIYPWLKKIGEGHYEVDFTLF